MAKKQRSEKGRLCSVNNGVGERRVEGEVVARAAVDDTRVRMPE